MDPIARHLIAEYYGCDPRRLDEPEALRPILEQAVIAGKATVIKTSLHHFSPQGVSGVVILAESHLAVHTWPELGFAAVEMLVCGKEPDPEAAHHYLLEQLKPSHHTIRVLQRGDLVTARHYARRGPTPSGRTGRGTEC